MFGRKKFHRFLYCVLNKIKIDQSRLCCLLNNHGYVQNFLDEFQSTHKLVDFVLGYQGLSNKKTWEG